MVTTISVNKQKIAELIILIDNAEKLSMALEDNNQECRILLHSLISKSKAKHEIKERIQKLLEDRKK